MQQTHKQQQFSALLQQHRGIIYSVINSYCYDESWHDDLFQEIAIKAWSAYDSFRGESKFTTWLYKVAQNVSISRLRKLNNLSTIKMVLTDNIFWEIEDVPYQEDEPPVQLSIMDKLSDREKRTLQMRLDGLSFEEISEQMGEPRSRLIVRMHRIKKSLSKSIKQQS